MSENAGIIRVVVADDSEIAAAFLERLLEADAQIRVVGRARNGAELLAMPQRGIAQVILLDVLMPEVGGLSVLPRLTARCPVIAISSVAEGSAVPMEALSLGAVAFFSKRDLAKPEEAERLREAVRSAAGRPSAGTRAARPARAQSVVLVGGSTGAILPLEQLIRDLQGSSVPVLVVQHMPEGKDDTLPHLLNSRGLAASVATNGAPLTAKTFVAPAGRHMEIDAHDRIRLLDSPPVNGHRPSADVLFRSAARLGHRAVGVVLSGLGNDGADGIGALADQGGLCFAQHPDDCQASSMPRAALAMSRRVKPVRAMHLGQAVRMAAVDGRA
jgi:two-component system chemotaxis response regulator CheB